MNLKEIILRAYMGLLVWDEDIVELSRVRIARWVWMEKVENEYFY